MQPTLICVEVTPWVRPLPLGPMRLCLLAVLANDPPLALPPPGGGVKVAAEAGTIEPTTRAMVAVSSRLRATMRLLLA